MAEPQLTIDGDEVENPLIVHRGTPGLNTTQRQILAKLDEQGHIRSVEAGVIVHAARSIDGCPGSMGQGWSGFKGTGKACCPYASEDGRAALKRLAKRGIVKRVSPGRWER